MRKLKLNCAEIKASSEACKMGASRRKSSIDCNENDSSQPVNQLVWRQWNDKVLANQLLLEKQSTWHSIGIILKLAFDISYSTRLISLLERIFSLHISCLLLKFNFFFFYLLVSLLVGLPFGERSKVEQFSRIVSTMAILELTLVFGRFSECIWLPSLVAEIIISKLLDKLQNSSKS